MCIVLGMGMPTVAVYILLAVLVAPSLVEVGVEPMAAHMFIFYFGMMSFITPPVAIAAFFAANLAGAEPMRTGFAAMRFGWTAYIVPFVFSPVLLLQGGTTLDLLFALATTITGIWLICVGITGYFVRPLSWYMRACFVISGILLMVPRDLVPYGIVLDIAGLALGAILVAVETTAVRRLQKA